MVSPSGTENVSWLIAGMPAPECEKLTLRNSTSDGDPVIEVVKAVPSAVANMLGSLVAGVLQEVPIRYFDA